jgi:signal transduction histidine kinase
MIVQADAGRLVTVFEHLIRNAQDATPANGEIGVDARVASGEVIVSITDTGKGMTSQFIRERLFRPFDSTAARAWGSGRTRHENMYGRCKERST